MTSRKFGLVLTPPPLSHKNDCFTHIMICSVTIELAPLSPTSVTSFAITPLLSCFPPVTHPLVF